MDTDRDKKFLNALNSVPGVGYDAMKKLRAFFSSCEEGWVAGQHALAESGIGEDIAAAIVEERLSIDPDKEMERLVKEGVRIIEAHEPDFPELLKEIPAPPQWLYIKGKLPESSQALGVVGSRKATSYGKEATSRIIAGLGHIKNLVIVSGCAIGIDQEAHRSALAHGLTTVAVLGSGLDRNSFYPSIHLGLAEEIVEKNGALISEYPFGMPAFKQNFIQRNRLISGLTRGVLVVEAAQKSGALITAHFALEQGRAVMAIPGSIFSPYAAGVHGLLRQGARLVESAEDVIDELGFEVSAAERELRPESASSEGREILKNLSEPRSVDDLVSLLGRNAQDVITGLSVLELEKRVKNFGGRWMRL